MGCIRQSYSKPSSDALISRAIGLCGLNNNIINFIAEVDRVQEVIFLNRPLACHYSPHSGKRCGDHLCATALDQKSSKQMDLSGWSRVVPASTFFMTPLS